MKKILSIAAVFAFALGSAQIREKGNVELLPQIGVSSSNYYGTEFRMYDDPLIGMSFGVGADYFLNSRWSLRTGLHYQKMGAKVRGIYDEKLNYLTLPLNANWHFGSSRNWNLNFGPSFSFLMSAKNYKGNIKDELNTFQMGLAYGVGYKIELNPNFSILVDLQGQTFYSSVYKEANSSSNFYSSINVGGVFKL